MKIEKVEGKYLGKHWFYYYYQHGNVSHGLFNGNFDFGIGYNYHGVRKGFSLRNKKWL